MDRQNAIEVVRVKSWLVGRLVGRRYVAHGRRRPLLHQGRNWLCILDMALNVLLTAFAAALKVGEVADQEAIWRIDTSRHARHRS